MSDDTEIADEISPVDPAWDFPDDEHPDDDPAPAPTRRKVSSGVVRTPPAPADQWEIDHDRHTLTLISRDGDSMVIPLDEPLISAVLDGLSDNDLEPQDDHDEDEDDDGYDEDDEGFRGSKLVKSSGWTAASEWWEVIPAKWRSALAGGLVAIIVLIIAVRLITG